MCLLQGHKVREKVACDIVAFFDDYPFSKKNSGLRMDLQVHQNG